MIPLIYWKSPSDNSGGLLCMIQKISIILPHRLKYIQNFAGSNRFAGMGHVGGE